MSLFKALLAILLPPVAVLMTAGFGGKFLFNLVLTALFWIPGAIHALLVVSNQPDPVPA
jgi:uncharacterized membrane protein YqaE (UPF0057 family)